MKTIAHISDLHFGQVDPAVAQGLIADLHRQQPSLVIVSGDLTQRARRSQYKAAAGYMKELPQPRLCVPGNHDIPLFDVAQRFLSPLDRYKHYISKELFPCYTDGNLTVLGINTARSLTWKSGRISTDQIQETERILSGLPKAHFKVVVTHHPFIPPPGQEDAGIKMVGRASHALEVFEQYKVDLLLSGHLHHGYTGNIRTYYPSSKRSIIAAQAGTAISNRVRQEPNGYNLIRLEPGHIEVEVRQWTKTEFSKVTNATFTQENGQWRPDQSKGQSL